MRQSDLEVKINEFEKTGQGRKGEGVGRRRCREGVGRRRCRAATRTRLVPQILSLLLRTFTVCTIVSYCSIAAGVAAGAALAAAVTVLVLKVCMH